MGTNYTVNAGDNLWNICKRAFNLTSSTDIAKKVKEVAKANNLQRPELIFPGQKINLDMGLTVEKTGQIATDPIKEEGQQIANQAQMAALERIKLDDIKTYEDMENLQKSSVSIFSKDIKTDEQKQNAYTQYSEELLKKYYDENGDGKVTTEEFAKVKKKGFLTIAGIQNKKITESTIASLEKQPEMLKEYDDNGDGRISEKEYTDGQARIKAKIIKGIEEIPEMLKKYDDNGDGKISDKEYNEAFGIPEDKTDLISERYSNLFAKNLDMDNDGIISAKEMAFFNQNADEIDGKLDGVITNAGESGMEGAITGKNASSEDINRVVNKYLAGETLTADEQKILDESSTLIKKNMRKAAGMED